MTELREKNRVLAARVSDLVAELERKRRGLKPGQLASEREAVAKAGLPDEEARRARLRSQVAELRKARDKQAKELEGLKPRVETLERVQKILHG